MNIRLDWSSYRIRETDEPTCGNEGTALACGLILKNPLAGGGIVLGVARAQGLAGAPASWAWP
jgi:hypothetical protein